MVLLFERDGSVNLLLTERPATLSRHPGQISLPGGARDSGDASLWETALRETREELGFEGSNLLPLGRLPAVQVNVSRYTVTPFVAWSAARPELAPDAREVAAVIEVPLELFLDPQSVETESWDFSGVSRRVAFYRVYGRIVWGATARVLAELVACTEAESPSTLPGSVE